MRLSVNSEDRGYAAWKALPKCVIPFITVDGTQVPRVITADDRLGYVLVIDEDDNEHPKINARRSGFMHKQLHGKVVIELRGTP